MFKPNRDEWYAMALAACQKKYGQSVDTGHVESAVDNLLDVFSEDDGIAGAAHQKVCNYVSYPVDKSIRFRYPVEKLAIETIVGKKFSGSLYARRKAVTDWIRVQEGKDAVDVTRPSPLPQTKNKIGKVVTGYINQARKDKNNNLGLTKYAFKLDGGYTMYTNSFVAVRTKEDWGLDKAAFTSGVVPPTTDIWNGINEQPSIAVRIDRYQVEVFADLGLQVDFKVAEGLSLYFVASQIMFLFKVLDAKSLVFYTPRAKIIEGRYPCYFGSMWYCQNEHGEAVFMPRKHDDDEHPIVCDISKQVQIIDGRKVTMAKTTKVEKINQTTKEVVTMKKSAKCKALENAVKKSKNGYATMYKGKLLADTDYYTIWTDAEWSKAFDPALILENKIDNIGFPVAVTKDGKELPSFSWFLHTIKDEGRKNVTVGWAKDGYDYYKRKGDATLHMYERKDTLPAKFGISMEDMKEVTKILTSTAVSLTFDKRYDSNFVYRDDHTDMVIRSVKEYKKEGKDMSKTIPTNCVGCDRISNDEHGKPFCNFHGPSVDLSERGNHGCSYRDGKKKTTAEAIRNKAEQVAGKEWADKHLVVATTAPTTPAVTSKATAKATKKTTAKKSAKVEAPTPQPSQFTGLTTMEQVRQRYMELIQQGIEPNMEQYTTAFNAAHDAELKAAQDSGKYIGKLLKEQSPTEGYREAIAVAVKLAKDNGVEVKVEGCYIWISNTKREDMECRNTLKGAGFWWAKNRKQWYWRPAFLYKKEA